MNLQTTFQVSIYGLAALAGAILASGEEAFFPSGASVLLSILALILNERWKVVRLGLLSSNFLGLAALGMALYEFFGDRVDARLLAGAHFLVYLNWLVLFQEKRFGQYWWIFALSLLQVAVGSVLTLSAWYGFYLLVYLVLAFWTIAVMHLYQAAITFGVEGADAAILADDTLASIDSSADGGEREFSDSSLAGMRRVDPLDIRTTSDCAVQQDRPHHWISPRFTFGVVGISLSGLALGMLIFLLVPRKWLSAGNVLASQGGIDSRVQTGFPSQVRLGHLGRILESNEKVLEVRLFDNDTDRPIPLGDFAARQGLAEPLFRGSVLDVYESGQWSIPDSDGRTTDMRFRPRPQATGLVRQEYILTPQESNILFGLRPIVSGVLVDPAGPISIHLDNRVLSARSKASDRIRYRIFSRPYSVGAGRGGFGLDGRMKGQFSDLPGNGWRHSYCLELPQMGLEELRALATAWTEPGKLRGDARSSLNLRRALTIESRLRDSGEFTYSLNMTVQDPDRDPVEDFLFNRKSGHCEYFASALALMLRAVGVPSRLVTGFKGAVPVNGNEHYEVQQRHAHAWVEAYVDEEWIVLDATPGTRDEEIRLHAADSDFWRNAGSSLSELWSAYVLHKQPLYDPLKGQVPGQFGLIGDVVRQSLAVIHWMKLEITGGNGTGERFSGSVMALVFGGLAAAALAMALLRRALRFRRGPRARDGYRLTWLSRIWRNWIARWWRHGAGPRVVVEFYEQFLDLVASRGLNPRPDQTPREFARTVELALVDVLSQDGLATLPWEVTELYNRVRFGGADCPAEEVRQLDRRIRGLAEALLPSRRRRAAARPLTG
jgi:transglutaminase-like putative cysteine protease